ncbi:GTP pyrophosphokinase [Paracoccus sediminicola]|uniref:GTP pyrophosphokinase n=1 Tax=Paracoccus sediminicola TaxID=3017783 RepID=UPI0022F01B90|nr:hypothetical protein [Paracoccus sediminicola]WBU58801.1 hypothetical protein PAF18_17460 [Paracoccus sediminicola]
MEDGNATLPSLDFEHERDAFRHFYNDNSLLLEEAKESLVSLISALLRDNGEISFSKIEGRVKSREECILKFIRKYRSGLEQASENYTIRDHISDIIGLRVVCLYESDIKKVISEFESEFEVIEITDKSAEIEGTDATFGYKGTHADLKIKPPRSEFSEYRRFKDFQFEVQIRTVVQDAWSTLDHKIKYKKSIPQNLKRRINTLAALFELADREFLEIREETERQVEVAKESYEEIEKETDTGGAPPGSGQPKKFTRAPLDAFSFLRIANHFFPDFTFEDHKVDGFVDEIQSRRSETTRGKFNWYMKNGISAVKDYADHKAKNDGRRMNPFTLMRHSLYYSDPDTFHDIISESARKDFDAWLKENGHPNGVRSEQLS